MALQQVTYKTITDTIRTFLVNECCNVGTNYTNITDQWFHNMDEPTWVAATHEFGPGHTPYTYGTDGKKNPIPVYTHDPHYKIWSISDITQYTANSVNTDITNFVKNILGINENAIIPSTNEFYNFLGNMLSYVSYRTGFIVSTMSQDTIYMIFLNSGTPPVTRLNKDEKITAEQITRLFNIVMDIEYQKERVLSMTNRVLLGDFESNHTGLLNIKTSQTDFK